VSTLFSPVNVLAMVLFAVTLARRIYQAVRAPTVPNWAVTAAVAGFASAFLLQQKVFVDWIDGMTGRGGARVGNNALLACALCALVIFFLGSALGPRRRMRRAVLELIPLAAAIALMVVAMSLIPVALRGEDMNAANVHDTGIALFYLGAGLYLSYGIVACVWWILRYQRTADRDLRTGLRIAAAGLTGAAIGSVLRASYIVLAWAGGPAIRALLLSAVPFVILGSFLFLIGITYPGVRARLAALRRRRQHRRDHRLLAPLWTVLAGAFPTIVLRSPPRGRWSPQHVHRAYYRRVIEIRDGLVQLSPYLDTELGSLAADDPAAAAEALQDALTRHAAGESSDGRAKQILPAEGDLESDVRPLLALSAAVSGNGA